MSETFTGRAEDRRFLTGAGRYAADVHPDGLLHVAFVRSPFANARVEALDAQAARALPGVVAVLTAEDLAADGVGPVAGAMNVRGPDGQVWRETPRPLLVGEAVRFVGEPVALVIAETSVAAADAVEAVTVDYAEAPAVVDVPAALASDAPLVWEERSGNVALHWRHGDWPGVEAALGASHHVARLRTAISRAAAAPMEPRVAVAVPDAASDRTTLYLSHQNAQGMRASIAGALGLPPEAVHVIVPDVGGSFGMKGGLLREETVVFWAARRLGRPLRWTADRTEAFLTDEGGRDMLVEAALGLDPDGHFTALEVTLQVNVGAYASGRSTVPIMNMGGIAGVYRTPVIAGEFLGVFTHTVPTAPYRGAGRPEATFAVERVIDVAARELGIDPFELRRRNLIPAEAMPYRTPFTFHYDSGDFARTMTIARERADWAGFPARREAAGKAGLLRGIGVANPIEVAGGPFGNPGEDFSDLRVNPDGTVTLTSGMLSAGQGLETVLVDLAANALELPAEAFRYVQGDSEIVPKGKGMGGSSGLITGGSAVVRASERLMAAARDQAADALEAAEADLEYAGGTFRIVGTDRTITLGEVAGFAESRGGALAGNGSFRPEDATYPNGCHVCEVEIDPETGGCRVVAYTAVEDVGRVLYPTLASGQIHGGAAQGLGQVLFEAMAFGTDGQVLSASFMDYAMPRAGDLPFYDSDFADVPTARNPLGVKGVGEAGTVGALSAAMNAVCDALASAGVDSFDMPATPGRIWTALAAAKERRGL